MLYATLIKLDEQNNVKGARLLEPYVGIDFMSDAKQLRKLIKNGIGIANIKLDNNGLKYANWPYMIKYKKSYGNLKGCQYVLLGKNEDGNFHLADTLGIHVCDTGTVLQYIHNRDVANCIETIDGVNTFGTTDLFPYEDTLNNMHKDYEKFLLKTRTLGLDLRFEFKVKGDHIILSKYLGTSRNVIIPSFVYAIANYVFFKTDIHEVQLNEGLRIIGDSAFYQTNLESITIPESVQLVGSSITKFSDNINVQYESKKTVIAK